MSKGQPIPSRSGTGIFDLYGLEVRSAPTGPDPSGKPSGRRTAFAIDGHPLPSARSPNQDAGQLLAEVEWQTILVAFAPVGGNDLPTLVLSG